MHTKDNLDPVGVKRGWYAHTIVAAVMLLALQDVVSAAKPESASGNNYSSVTAWHWADAKRVVAFGDVHGAYDQLEDLLTNANLIDDELHWIGGDTHLVSVGDLMDRGPESRKVLDLLMRLEHEAKDAGGRVHVVMGNHELMMLIADLRYVSDEEYAEFAGDEEKTERNAAYERYLANNQDGEQSPAEIEKAFKEAYPPGYFAQRAAFAVDGRYGRWLLKRPVLLVVNDTVFVHGGLPTLVTELGGEEINRRLNAELRQFLAAWHKLVAAGILAPEDIPQENLSAVKNRLEANDANQTKMDPAIAAAAQRFVDLGDSSVFYAEGPLWYRGTAKCHPITEASAAEAALERLGVARVVMGHTPAPGNRVSTRLNGLAVMIDTGMFKEYFKGRWSGLFIEDSTLEVLYQDEKGFSQPIVAPKRQRARPGKFTDAELEEFLRQAEIVEKDEDTGTMTLSRNGKKLKAVFKTASKKKPKPGTQEYQFEIAAYRLDRMLGLEMVPVAVQREIDGDRGSLSVVIKGLITEQKRNDESVAVTGWCPLADQHQLMYALDALIYNENRTLDNIVYTEFDWKLFLINNAPSFGKRRTLPAYLQQAEITLPAVLVNNLAGLDMASLQERLGDLISESQLKALLKRRDSMLDSWGH